MEEIQYTCKSKRGDRRTWNKDTIPESSAEDAVYREHGCVVRARSHSGREGRYVRDGPHFAVELEFGRRARTFVAVVHETQAAVPVSLGSLPVERVPVSGPIALYPMQDVVVGGTRARGAVHPRSDQCP